MSETLEYFIKQSKEALESPMDCVADTKMFRGIGFALLALTCAITEKKKNHEGTES